MVRENKLSNNFLNLHIFFELEIPLQTEIMFYDQFIENLGLKLENALGSSR